MSKEKTFVRIHKQTALAFRLHSKTAKAHLNFKHLIIYETIAGYKRGCTCTESTLGKWAGVSDNRTVRGILRDLQQCGLIQIRHRERKTSLILNTQEGKDIIRKLTDNEFGDGYIYVHSYLDDIFVREQITAPLARYVLAIVHHFSHQKGYGAWKEGRIGLRDWIPGGSIGVIKRVVKELINRGHIIEMDAPSGNTRPLKSSDSLDYTPPCLTKHTPEIPEDDDIPF